MFSGTPSCWSSCCGGFVALRSGVRGGSGTSHPNLTIAETMPPSNDPLRTHDQSGSSELSVGDRVLVGGCG